MRRMIQGAAVAVVLAAMPSSVQAQQSRADSARSRMQHAGHAVDTAFSALQERGRAAMGVDQYTSSHVFDSLEEGGRIELQRDIDDPDGVRTVRTHLRDIAARFAAGDFRIPGFVHAQEVPGTVVMARKRDAIRYTFHALPRGGEVRISASDPEAIAAIHEFLAFQRQDHRAGGHHH